MKSFRLPVNLRPNGVAKAATNPVILTTTCKFNEWKLRFKTNWSREYEQTVAKLGPIGDRYVCKIWTIYATRWWVRNNLLTFVAVFKKLINIIPKWWVPAKYAAKPMTARIQSGLSVFFRTNSLKDCPNDCLLWWVHFISARLQTTHDSVAFLYRFIDSNSCCKFVLSIHPRNHFSDLNAAFSRPLDNNHIGDSGTLMSRNLFSKES